MRTTVKDPAGRRGSERRDTPLETIIAAVALVAALLAIPSAPARAAAWPSDGIAEVERIIDSPGNDVPLDENIHVNWSVRLIAGDGLTGLYISEQVPEWMVVRNVEAYCGPVLIPVLHEAGEAGELEPGWIPHRFVFDDPDGSPEFILRNSDWVDLHFDVAAVAAGEARLDLNGWFAGLDDPQRPEIPCVGGYLEDSLLLCFSNTPLTLESLTISDETDHLGVAWSLMLDGASQSYQLYRGETEDPWTAQPVPGTQGEGPGAGYHKDYDVVPGRKYTYWIVLQGSGDAPASYLGPASGRLRDDRRMMAMMNHPNPFNPVTTIRFTLAETSAVDLAIFDATGRLVRRLASGELAAGEHHLMWDGTDDRGLDQATGVYHARLIASGHVRQIRKMTLIR